MNLLEKAKKEAKKNGRKVNPEVAKGLRAIQSMHDLFRKSKRSAYKIYVSEKEKSD